MTESLVITWNRVDAIRPGSIGTVADTVDARVVSMSGAPVPDGEVGEMAVRSPANFIGYWEDPAATAAAIQDGWLLTGDLGRRDAGWLLLVRRTPQGTHHPRRIEHFPAGSGRGAVPASFGDGSRSNRHAGPHL